MERKYLLLRIIAAADGERVTPTQLQKVAFLLGEDFRDEMPDDYYTFNKEGFGPHCLEIYGDADELRRERRIDTSRNPRGGWQEFQFIGYRNWEGMECISKPIADYIDETMRWARQKSFKELVSAVYTRFSEYRANSVFPW